MQIQCKLGYAETDVAGTPYVFQRDAKGRFVAEVPDIGHQRVLLSVEHYQAVSDEPAPAAPAAAPEPQQPDPVAKDDPEPQGAPQQEAPGLGTHQAADTAQGEPQQPAPAAPKPAQAPKPAAGTPVPFVDDVIRINGIGASLKAKLSERGITSLHQIANLDEDGIAKLDKELELYGRIVRDNWIGQARELVAGATE